MICLERKGENALQLHCPGGLFFAAFKLDG
jgi:hypothetical protein